MDPQAALYELLLTLSEDEPDRDEALEYLDEALAIQQSHDPTSTDVAYTSLPTDGIDSLDLEAPGGTVNTPQNFAGASGSTCRFGRIGSDCQLSEELDRIGFNLFTRRRGIAAIKPIHPFRLGELAQVGHPHIGAAHGAAVG